MTLPNKAPWTSIGASGQPMRWELRIHGFGSQFPNLGFNLGPVQLWEQIDANWVSAATHFTMDTVYNNGPIVNGCCQGRTDVLVRVQRDVANSQWTNEICDTTGGKCQSITARILTFGPPSWAGFSINPTPGESVAFVRWYSSVVPLGTPIPVVRTTGDLGDWEFEGDLTDSSGHGFTMSGGAYSFVPTPAYLPVCTAGKPQSFRAGYQGTLDGTGSSPLDGGATLTFLWQQLSGPPATWGRTLHPIIGRGGLAQLTTSDQNSAQPVISGLAPGSYTFQLTVTDGSGQSSVCTVNDGAVETDDNGVVITNNPAVDTLLGPLIRYGANPWPWFDDRHKAAADVQIANMDPYYGAWWDVADPGTVTVTIGSATVTGVGTTFTTTFCQGPSNPTVPLSASTSIVVWYPTGVPGQAGRRMRSVVSCQSDTQLTMSGIWFPSDVPDGSGLGYADNANWGTWAYGAAPANYYDNVAGFYALYYRSGIVDYLNAARKLADRFWECPQLDRGNSATGNGTGGGWPNRSVSMLGLVLRALDGRPEMFAGMERFWQFQLTYEFGNNSEEYAYLPSLWDVREVAYELAELSYCALYDTSRMKAACQAKLSTIIPGYFAITKMADRGWEQLTAHYFSWTATPTTVTLTHGSTAVVGNGTSWASNLFPTSNTLPAMWFLNSISKPNSNAGGDPTTYNPSWVDSTHLTLDRPYEGATGNHGWVLSTPVVDSPFVGYGTNVYMEGLLSMAFDFAAKAIADSDPVNSALARSYNLSSANWIKTYGYRASQKSTYYGAGFVNCQPPISEDPWNPCNGAGKSGPAWTGASSRVLNSEAMRGLMTAYAYSQDPDLKNLIDVMYNGMWAKPTTCPTGSTVCVPDGIYLSQFDPGGDDISGTPPLGSAPKWFGQMWGISALSGWPAYRLGPLPPQTQHVFYVAFNLGSVRNAVKVRVRTTIPNGEVLQTDCASSPCAVTTQYPAGDHPVQLQYLSVSGRVLATSETLLVPAGPQ